MGRGSDTDNRIHTVHVNVSASTRSSAGKARAGSPKTHGETTKSSGPTGVPTKRVGAKSEATLPLEDRPNPYAHAELPAVKHDRLKQIHFVKAHDMAISSYVEMFIHCGTKQRTQLIDTNMQSVQHQVPSKKDDSCYSI